jgi:putative membrane protein
MEFIDYVTLMLINMSAAFAVLAVFLGYGITQADRRSWAGAFAVPGVVAAVCGFVMTFTWPLPHPYNIAFGEMSIFLGVLLFAAAVALAKNWRLNPLGIYAFFAGVAAIVIGIRFMEQGLTNNPPLSGAGFILSGLGGVFAPFVLAKKDNKFLRAVGIIVLVGGAGIWAWIGYFAYWTHLSAGK